MPLLEAHDIAHAFGGLQALGGVGLAVEAQEIVGVIGPNGAGKSTLFNVLAGFLRPDSGRIAFDGRDLSGRPPEAVARAGLVKTFQTARPFASMTFADNVMIGALGHELDLGRARALAERCLGLVDLAEHALSPARGASTGQRKRLEIARALATRPRLLLLDEPFGGVDQAAIEGLIALLRTIRDQGVTLLVIEHNLEAVQRLVDRLIAMSLGLIIAEGDPDAVTRDPRVVQAYLGGDAEAEGAGG
jgi:branched-chain amino acid transport system ATP-binding protein